MPITVGPSAWWLRTKDSANYYAKLCPVGTILPDASAVFCKAGGRSWIVSPISTEVCTQWADGPDGTGKYNNTCVTTDLPNVNIQCVNQWNGLCTRLISCGFNPCDWFVPTFAQLSNFRNFRNFWDSCTTSPSGGEYHTATECSFNTRVLLRMSDGFSGGYAKSLCQYVRAFRCVTY